VYARRAAGMKTGYDHDLTIQDLKIQLITKRPKITRG